MPLIDVNTYPVPHDKGNGSGGGNTYINGGGKSSTYNSINVQSVNASKGNIDYLQTKSVSANDASIMYLMTREGQIIRLSGNELNYNSGYIGALSSDTINTNKIKTTDLEAVNAFIDSLQSKNITTEYLTVTKQAHFFELVIDKIRSVGGCIILTPASCVVDYVLAHKQDYGFVVPVKNEYTAYDYFRVFWRATDNYGKAVSNEFKEDDQVICQSFNNAVHTGTNYNVSNKYYWRLVTGTGYSQSLEDVWVNFSTGAISETTQHTDVNEFQILMTNTEAKKLDPYLTNQYYQNNIVWTAAPQTFKDKDGNEIAGIKTNVSWTDNNSKGQNEAVYGIFRTASQVYGIEIKPNAYTITNKLRFFITQKSGTGYNIAPKYINIGIYFTDDTFRVYNAVDLKEDTGEYNINLDDIDAPIESIVIVSTADVDWHLCHCMDISNIDKDTELVPNLPEAGDNLVQLGYRGNDDTGRQNAIIISAYNAHDPELTPPYYAQYMGVGSDSAFRYNLPHYRKTYFDANGANFVGNFKLTNGNTLDQQINSNVAQYNANNAWKNNKIYVKNTDNITIRIDRTKSPGDYGYHSYDPETLDWEIRAYVLNTSGSYILSDEIPNNFIVKVVGYYKDGSQTGTTLYWPQNTHLNTTQIYPCQEVWKLLTHLKSSEIYTKNIDDFNSITVELIYNPVYNSSTDTYTGGTVIDRNKIGITVIPLAIDGVDGRDGATGPAGPAGPTGATGPSGAPGSDANVINTLTDVELLVSKLTSSNVDLYCDIVLKAVDDGGHPVPLASRALSELSADSGKWAYLGHVYNKYGEEICTLYPRKITDTTNTYYESGWDKQRIYFSNLLTVINPSSLSGSVDAISWPQNTTYSDPDYWDYQKCAEKYPSRCPLYIRFSRYYVAGPGASYDPTDDIPRTDRVIYVKFETGVLFEKLDDRITSKIQASGTGQVDLAGYATQEWCQNNFSEVEQTATGIFFKVKENGSYNTYGTYNRDTIDTKIANVSITADQIESVMGDDYYTKTEVDSAINNAIGDPNYFNQVLDLYTDTDFDNNKYYPVIVNVGTATNVSENGPMLTCQVDCSLDEFPDSQGYPSSSRPSWGGLYPQDSHNRGVALICNWSVFCNLHGDWNNNEKNVYINTYELKYTRKSGTGNSSYDIYNSINKIKVIGGPSDSSGIVQYNGYLIFYLRGGAKYNFRFSWPNLHPTVYKTGHRIDDTHNYPVYNGADSASVYAPNLDRMWRSQILQEADRISLNVWTAPGMTGNNGATGAGYQYLLNTGIDIGTREINLKANKVKFTNSAGTVTDKISIDPTTGTLNATNAHISGDFTFKVTYQDVATLAANQAITANNIHSFYILAGPAGESHTITLPHPAIFPGLQIQFFKPCETSRTVSMSDWHISTPQSPSPSHFYVKKFDGMADHSKTSIFVVPGNVLTFIASSDYWYEVNNTFTAEDLAQ